MSIDGRNQQVNEVLENRYDQLNSAIEQAEDLLKGMRLSGDTEVWYDKWENETHQYNEYACIGMIKLNGVWRLCHGYTDDARQVVDSWKPLRDATIHERLRAIKGLDKLREKIVDAKEKTVLTVEEAIAKMANLLGAWEHDSTSEDT